jgi:hypothetical protein
MNQAIKKLITIYLKIQDFNFIDLININTSSINLYTT